jgi:hypothetical protein
MVVKPFTKLQQKALYKNPKKIIPKWETFLNGEK